MLGCKKNFNRSWSSGVWHIASQLGHKYLCGFFFFHERLWEEEQPGQKPGLLMSLDLDATKVNLLLRSLWKESPT